MELPIVLKSRRFWVSIVGVIFMVLVQIIPGLVEHADTLQNAVLILVGLLIGGYTAEDFALAWKNPEAAAEKLSK